MGHHENFVIAMASIVGREAVPGVDPSLEHLSLGV